ncbi:hypothetical protein BC332_11019, partial [Capsicum chinense]
YKKLLSSVDLTKDFFYSYTYPIMRSLQKNVLSTGEDGMPYDNLFVWNSYLTHTIRSRCKNTMWTIALVHGHFKQGICLNGLRCRLITDSPFASPFGRHILLQDASNSIEVYSTSGEVLSSTGPPICFEEVLNTTPPICSREVLSSVAPQPTDQSIPIKDDYITAVDTSGETSSEPRFAGSKGSFSKCSVSA